MPIDCPERGQGGKAANVAVPTGRATSERVGDDTCTGEAIAANRQERGMITPSYEEYCLLRAGCEGALISQDLLANLIRSGEFWSVVNGNAAVPA